MLFFILYALSFKGKLSSRLYTALVVFGVMIVSEILSGIILMNIHQGNLDYIHDNIVFYLQGVVLSKLLTFTICRIISFFKERDVSIINVRTVISLTVITISSITSIYYIAMYVYNTNGIISGSVALILTLLIIFSFICTFWVFDSIVRNQKEQLKTEYEKRQYQSQIIHYNQLNEQQIEIRRLNHDIANILTGISGLLASNDTETALNKIKFYLSECGENTLIDCGNSAVDSLLNAKKSLSESKNILFEHEVIISHLNIDEIDFCIMLGTAKALTFKKVYFQVSSRQELP